MLKPRHYCSWTKYSANIASAYFLHKTSIKVVVLLWWPKHVPKRVINMRSCCYYTFYDVLIAVFYNVALIPWWQFKEDDVNMWLIPYSHYVVSIFDLNNSILLGNNILKITIFLKNSVSQITTPQSGFFRLIGTTRARQSPHVLSNRHYSLQEQFMYLGLNFLFPAQFNLFKSMSHNKINSFPLKFFN